VALQILLNDTYKLNHCKEMGAKLGRRFLKQPAEKLKAVFVVFLSWQRLRWYRSWLLPFSFTITFKVPHARYFVTTNKICNILTNNKLAEHLDRMSNVELLRLFLFGLSDAPTQILVAVFCAVDELLKSCDRFWLYLNIMHHSCVIRVLFSCCILFISARRDTTRVQ